MCIGRENAEKWKLNYGTPCNNKHLLSLTAPSLPRWSEGGEACPRDLRQRQHAAGAQPQHRHGQCHTAAALTLKQL